ncbi:MAG: sterol desaturase family protein [Nannocystis sp.]|nr:sterol desaturase family protein [Nannocystis sp.]
MPESALDIPPILSAPAGLAEALAWASGVLVMVGVPMFVVELVSLSRERRLDRRRLLGLLTSAFCLIPATAIEIALGGALVQGIERIGALAPWSIPTTWATALACLVLADLTYYWEHRAAHRIHALWAAYHSVHHSAGHYDQSIGLRVSFMDFFFTPLFYLPLVLIGFHPLLVLACLVLVLAWQQWIHTEVIGRLAWLDPWLNTPSNHRVHHGRNHDYLDRNYGGILIVWDRLFGTYAAERERVEYGLVEPLVGQDPLAVHFHGLAKLGQRLRASKGIGEGMRALLGPP